MAVRQRPLELLPGLQADGRRQAEFFLFFARTVFPRLEHDRPRLAAVYTADNGRPAWDPVRLLGVLVLQFVLRVADRQAAELVPYDQRWRLALHLRPEEPTFDPSLLTVFRNRLVEGAQEELAFTAVLDYLVEHGWVPKRSKRRLDSTHVRGLLSLMSRLEGARETIRLLLEALEAAARLPEAWAPYWARYVETKVEPRAGAPALEATSVQTGHDLLRIWEEVTGNWDIVARDAFVLLPRVFLENYSLSAGGQVEKTRAPPTGAVHNPHEPEAQWSSKSTTRDKSWVGYKAQVAETVQDEPREPGEPTANFPAALETQNATASDKSGMAQVLDAQQVMGLEAGAYVSSEAIKHAREEGLELRGPAPASPDRGKVFTVETFKQDRRKRNGIEITQSERVRGYGLRQSRYRGLAKVRLQNYLIGAACNVRRLFRRIQWVSAQTGRVGGLPSALAG